MAFSRKQKRKLARLRKDADRLWAEQQVVFDKARVLAGSAGGQAKAYAEKEILPQVSKVYESNVRPAFDKGVGAGRCAVGKVSDLLGKTVIPAAVAATGAATGAVKEFIDNNDGARQFADRAESFSKQASSRVQAFQAELGKSSKELKKAAKREKSGPGIGGWFLIGAGIAAVAAVGYALWQTFRADDDLWIADEELDAPVTTITPNA